MRVRKKLIVLHTLFTAALASILLVTLGPSLRSLIHAAEIDKAAAILQLAMADPNALGDRPPQGVYIFTGEAAASRLTADQLAMLTAHAGEIFDLGRMKPDADADLVARVAVWQQDNPASVLAENGVPMLVETTIVPAREGATRLFALIVVALLAVYILVAAALELLVLPGALYAPIERLLRADQAVQDAQPDQELIPEPDIPADEFGAIMRSRNASVLALRSSERRLGDALEELELAAAELKRKNHLLETARRNLEGADRLASLGMMSAGIAHELNTPLAVLKGLTERIGDRPGHRATPEESALMRRVVGRLERLGESLLDFARVREPRAERVRLEAVVSEAITLVGLDRKGSSVELLNAVPASIEVLGDPDRLVQVFVNLVRNAVDAVATLNGGGQVRVTATQTDREPSEPGGGWVVAIVEDTGPGLDPGVIPRLFEPFFSTRLDARGTGLGLAVAEGIVREHGGVLVGRNRDDRRGSQFEITLPAAGDHPPEGPPETSPEEPAP